MDPINYSVDVATPFQSALQGYQAGAAIRNDQTQQAQQQAALAQQQKQQQLLAGLASNPNATADDYASVMTQIPAIAEHLQKAWTTKNTAQQQSHASDLLQWGAAIKSGKPEIAADQMTQRAEAMERVGGGNARTPTRESQALRVQAQIIKEHPEFALGQIQAMLAANPNGKDAAESLSKFGTEQRAQELQPSALATATAGAAKAGSDATTAAVTAKFAEPAAIAELTKKGWDVENIKSEIGYRKESNRIAAMTAAAAKEGNALKREELGIRIKEAQNTLDQSIRTRAADAESAAGSIDNTINTIERIKKNPSLDSVVGSLQGRMPAVFSDEANDAIALIDTLGSQAFLSQIPSMKGQGSLSNAEGEKLQSALTNLGRGQSEKQFRENLDDASRLMKKARENISKRSGVPLAKPDTPAAPGARPPLSSFNQSAGGAGGSY